MTVPFGRLWAVPAAASVARVVQWMELFQNCFVYGRGYRMAGKTNGGARRERPGKTKGFDATFKPTRYGYPSTSARLAMQANASRRARNRVVGSKLTHNATLGYISRGAARRSGLDPAGWHRYVPMVMLALVAVLALALLGYAGHGQSLGKMLPTWSAPSLVSSRGIVTGAQNQTGMASSRAIVAAASTYAEGQQKTDDA